MRYQIIDEIRGITLVSMILYHGIWDLVYIFGWNLSWFQTQGAYLWQQSVCWMFILLSGFCWSLGKQKLKRGLVVFGAGILVSVVTIFIMPGERIVFGILNFLGSCMLFMIPMEKLLKKIKSEIGILGCLVLFFVFRNVNRGYLGADGIFSMELPQKWYQNYLTAYFGFPEKSFFSTDYFSVFPWIFLFMTGYFLYQFLKEKEVLEKTLNLKIRFYVFEILGKKSLLVYLCHQPIIYLVLMVANEVW